MKPKYDKCPTCGCNTRILSDEEGTSCYEAVDIEALRRVIYDKNQRIEALLSAVGDILYTTYSFYSGPEGKIVAHIEKQLFDNLQEVCEKVKEGK